MFYSLIPFCRAYTAWFLLVYLTIRISVEIRIVWYLSSFWIPQRAIASNILRYIAHFLDCFLPVRFFFFLYCLHWTVPLKAFPLLSPSLENREIPFSFLRSGWIEMRSKEFYSQWTRIIHSLNTIVNWFVNPFLWKRNRSYYIAYTT